MLHIPDLLSSRNRDVMANTARNGDIIGATQKEGRNVEEPLTQPVPSRSFLNNSGE
jgi:hypothetical protein